MNRRTFIKYLSCAPIALATSLASRPTSAVVREKGKRGRLTRKEKEDFLRTVHLQPGDLDFFPKKEKDDPGHTGVSRQQLEELERATLKDMPKMKEWRKELGQKEEDIKFGIEYWIDSELITGNSDKYI